MCGGYCIKAIQKRPEIISISDLIGVRQQAKRKREGQHRITFPGRLPPQCQDYGQASSDDISIFAFMCQMQVWSQSQWIKTGCVLTNTFAVTQLCHVGDFWFQDGNTAITAQVGNENPIRILHLRRNTAVKVKQSSSPPCSSQPRIQLPSGQKLFRIQFSEQINT